MVRGIGAGPCSQAPLGDAAQEEISGADAWSAECGNGQFGSATVEIAQEPYGDLDKGALLVYDLFKIKSYIRWSFDAADPGGLTLCLIAV